MSRKGWLYLLGVLCLVTVFATAASATTFLNIATGSTGGTYYPVGAGMAKIWNDTVKDIQASAQSTGGTVNNIQLMGDKESEMGFLDGLYYFAYTGQGRYEGDAQKYLRALVPLYPEPIQLMVAKGSGIKSMADMKGKRVSVGAVASGTEVTARQLLRLAGIDPDEDIQAENLGVGDTGSAFGDKRIDAAIMVGALGMAGVVEPTTLGLVDFIDVSDELLAAVMAETPYWVPFTMPAGTYSGQDKDVKTYASWNIVGIREEIDEEIVYQMTKALFDKRDDLIAVNSKMAAMVAENVKYILIPLHPGAERYYKEVGAIQ